MSTIRSINGVRVYEVNGTEITGIPDESKDIMIINHWNRRNLIVIEVNGEKYTVVADDLKRAIDNATNAHP